jgi:hypothetical protein
MRAPSLCGGLLAFAVLSCGAESPRPVTVSVRVEGTPAEASVTIDDVTVGRLDTVGARGLGLLPGPHRISVTAEGYFPSDQEIQCVTGQKQRVLVALRRIPP